MTNLAPAPVLDIVGAGQVFYDAFVSTIDELAAGMTVEVDGSATPVSEVWALPDRANLAPGGQIADEADQLTVLFTGITRGLPGATNSDGFVPPAHMMQFVTFEVNLIRLVSGLSERGDAPPPTVQASDWARTTLDAELTWATLLQIQAQNLVVPENRHFAFGPLITVGPEGRLAGIRCPVSWVWTKPLGQWAGP